MFQFGKLAIQSTVSTLGTTAIAAQAMTIILENLNGIAAIGIGIGLMTIVGQCIGAGEKEQAVYYIKKFCRIVRGGVVIICCLIIWGLTKPITMIAGMEPASADMCFYMMTVITIVKPIVWVPAFIPADGLRSRRCQIFYDFVHLFHVDLPSEPVHLSLPGTGIWTDRSVDRNVYRFDRAEYCVYNPVPQKKMAGSQSCLG